MAQQLTVEDARQSLTAHVGAKGAEIREKYGPHIGWDELAEILADRSCVRYPCEIVFGTGSLLPGEFAFAAPKGNSPEEGYQICVHPHFAARAGQVPYLVLYHLVIVNYGEFASADDAETFGAEALGLTKDDYYEALCAMADEVAAPQCG